MRIDIIQENTMDQQYHSLPKEILTSQVLTAYSTQRDEYGIRFYTGYLCDKKNVLIEIPNWERRPYYEDMADKKIKSVWMRIQLPYNREWIETVREVKKKIIKRDNPFDVYDYKGVIDILQQLRNFI